ncbi:MAG: hypothetical protein WDM71_05445 [Ferruginibacter sp.]
MDCFLKRGVLNQQKNRCCFQLEIDERKSPKENKQNYPDAQKPAFIYGKENFFYPIKLGVQQQILLGNKSNKNGVNITANYGGGITLGILRPYYIDVLTKDTLGNISEKYETFNDAFNSTDTTALLGGPTLGQGWDKLFACSGTCMPKALSVLIMRMIMQ